MKYKLTTKRWGGRVDSRREVEFVQNKLLDEKTKTNDKTVNVFAFKGYLHFRMFHFHGATNGVFSKTKSKS